MDSLGRSASDMRLFFFSMGGFNGWIPCLDGAMTLGRSESFGIGMSMSHTMAANIRQPKSDRFTLYSLSRYLGKGYSQYVNCSNLFLRISVLVKSSLHFS